MKRLFIQFSAAITLLLVFSFYCQGADKYTLEFNLEKGKTYTQHIVTNGDIAMNAMGQDMLMNMQMEVNVQFNVIDRNDSVYNIQMMYQKVKMDMTGPMSYSFDSDSTGNSSDNGAAAILRSLVGVPLDIQLTKLGKVLSVKGLDKLTDKINNSTTNPQVKQIISQQFSESSVQKLIEQTSAYFPGKPVAIGDSWNMDMNVSNNGINFIEKMQITLQEVKDNVATMGLTGVIATPEGGAVSKINGMDAKVVMDGTQAGTIRLNMQTGWNTTSDVNQKITSNIEVAGQTMLQKMDMKTTITGGK